MVVQTGWKENVTKKVSVSYPDQTFHWNADSDPASHQNDTNLRPLVYRPSRAPFSNLHAPNVSANGPLGLNFLRLKLLNLDFNADTDPVFLL